MEINATELIKVLAEQVGAIAPTIMEWHINLIPAEYFDFAVCLLISILLGLVIHVLIKQKDKNKKEWEKEGKSFEHRERDEGYQIVICITTGALCVFMLFTVLELAEVVRAVVSPEAYALDKIFDLLKE